MAFMTPIVRAGWNLYNVHPPIKIVPRKRPSKSKPQNKQSAKNQPFPGMSRRPRGGSLDAGSGALKGQSRSHIHIFAKTQRFVNHVLPNNRLQGHYFSDDCLPFRNQDVPLQAIPEEGEDEDAETASDEVDSCDNEEVTDIVPKERLTKKKRFLRRFRQFFGLPSESNQKAPTGMVSKVPLRFGQRQRS